MALPVVRDLLRKQFLTDFVPALILGIVGAELYWRYSCLPRQEKRDKYFENLNVKIEKPY